ncbi:MAG: triose-phosphate isomerase [Deltaproteobacteria bacterium RBG_13_43_22]|nr:MAG: triose-phosphate isomerase [Deltaproteobacteria bacterium RBG_13_43_22]
MKNKSRRPWIGGNWKMFKTIPETLDFIRELLAGMPNPIRTEVVIAPPFTAQHALGREIQGGPVQMAAQNVHWADEGAFTGEISTRMLRDAGCAYCIIGHSERRHLFGETDAQVRQKLLACLKAGLKPVLCVGETLEEREGDKIQDVITRQVQEAVQGLSLEDMAQGVIAYEPVWAIGTGRSATPAAAQEVHAFIRRLLEDRFNKTLAMEKRIVYGGSVTPENIRDLYAEPDIDGALVGGASLKPEKFLALIKEVN